ncbi:hypothetical protein CPB84DRAFT_1967952 [Gymnopilus junonius]|uniref:Uncharacterized protein n=1 Tax=Gymnopilus junonius TaxID=109634 RepID=A0A9P5N7U1_GYMJU|nr:hypothetical protein CPB84DRAFT_1967952 [Gymnopilus junonius]
MPKAPGSIMLPQLDHPLITHHSETKFFMKDPTNTSPNPHGEIIPLETIIKYIHHHQNICKYNPTTHYLCEPHGYLNFALMWNCSTVNEHIFATWNDSDQKYLVPPTTNGVTAADFNLTSLKLLAKPKPTAPTPAGPSSAPGSFNLPPFQNGSLISDLSAVAAAGYTQQQMMKSKYFKGCQSRHSKKSKSILSTMSSSSASAPSTSKAASITESTPTITISPGNSSSKTADAVDPINKPRNVKSKSVKASKDKDVEMETDDDAPIATSTHQKNLSSRK